VEFRHQQWFTEEIKGLLKEVSSIFCIADSPKTKLMDWVTSNVAYIRLHGRTSWYAYEYSFQELREIAEFVENVVKPGVTTVYIFFNNDFEGHAPKNALSLSEMLTKGGNAYE
jgi:uncharacterized protein YecE (DUF72 family)